MLHPPEDPCEQEQWAKEMVCPMVNAKMLLGLFLLVIAAGMYVLFGPLAALAMIATAFVAEYADSTLGMGYGTTLAPVLLALGYPVTEVVPALLASELITGFLAGLAHHSEGNVNLRQGKHLRATILLSVLSVVGVLAGANLAISLPKAAINTYIGAMVLMLGLWVLLLRRHINELSWWRLMVVGVVASFNKAMSGGGYGPVVTGGQLASGIEAKAAVGITSVAEGVTCVAALAVFACNGIYPEWHLTMPLVAGAVASVPFTAITVKRAGERRFRGILGIAMILLGTLTLWRVWG